jgi:hypothetical protein
MISNTVAHIDDMAKKRQSHVAFKLNLSSLHRFEETLVLIVVVSMFCRYMGFMYMASKNIKRGGCRRGIRLLDHC